MVSVFANGLENQGSIPGQVIPKIQNIVHTYIYLYIYIDRERERERERKRERHINIIMALWISFKFYLLRGRNPHGVVADIQDCNFVVSGFKLQLYYYVQCESHQT